MKLRFEQLAAHLKKPLAPIYLVHGDEPFQAGEAADAVRGAARAQGFEDRELFHADKGFDWTQLAAAADSFSLFGGRRVLEVRLPTGKPGDAGAKALTAYAERPPQDTVLLVLSGKLDSAQQRSKWFRALEGAGVTVSVWPVEAGRLPQWLQARMQARGLQPEPAAVALLAERVEGNLLAADQEIEKLRLLHGAGPVDVAAVAAAVSDSARYDVFALVDAAMQGDAARTARILQGLREEGQEPVLVLWALSRELRQALAVATAIAAGTSADAAMSQQRVWDKRKPVVAAALKRHRIPAWQALLRRAGLVDRVIKGARPGRPWDELLQLSLGLAGVRLFGAGARHREHSRG